jgi:heat shock protein HslJ
MRSAFLCRAAAGVVLLGLCGGVALAQSAAGYICQGNEPSWQLLVSPMRARLQHLSDTGDTLQRFSGAQQSLAVGGGPILAWRGAPPTQPAAVLAVVLRPEACTDTMADGTAFSHRAVVSVPGGAALTGCCRAAAAPDDALVGHTWTLQTIAGREIAAGVSATLAFDAAGRAAGNGGCNRFVGNSIVLGELIDIAPLAVTRMACAGPGGEVEKGYLAGLERAWAWRVGDGNLVLLGRRRQELLRFVPAEPAPIPRR